MTLLQSECLPGIITGNWHHKKSNMICISKYYTIYYVYYSYIFFSFNYELFQVACACLMNGMKCPCTVFRAYINICDLFKLNTLMYAPSCMMSQETAAILQQKSSERGGEVLWTADGASRCYSHWIYSSALQSAGTQTLGTLTYPSTVKITQESSEGFLNQQ